MTIGEKIKTFRKERKMTQKELADKAKLANSTIQQYEAEQYVPKIEQLTRIAEALGLSIYQLLDWDSDFQIEGVQGVYLGEYLDLHNQIERDFKILNSPGKIEAAKRVNELTQIEKYTKLED